MTKQHVLIAIALLAVALVAVVPARKARRNFLGYCEAQSRILSDRELADSAIADLLAYHRTPTLRHENGIQVSIPPDENELYKSVEQFRILNPDCCQVTRVGAEGLVTSYRMRFKGTSDRFIHISYLRHPWMSEQGATSREMEERILGRSNCGGRVPVRNWREEFRSAGLSGQ